MTGPDTPAEVIDQLRRQLRQLVDDLPGPVRRIRVRACGVLLEIEWPVPEAPSVPVHHLPAAAYPGQPGQVPPAATAPGRMAPGQVPAATMAPGQQQRPAVAPGPEANGPRPHPYPDQVAQAASPAEATGDPSSRAAGWNGGSSRTGDPAGPSTDTPDRHLVVAPIVGTFYRAPEPGAAPFVAVGDLVEAGQVVGIVEAMKLMNHITAEQPGRVTEVFVGDGEPVEYEQPLLALATATGP